MKDLEILHEIINSLETEYKLINDIKKTTLIFQVLTGFDKSLLGNSPIKSTFYNWTGSNYENTYYFNKRRI